MFEEVKINIFFSSFVEMGERTKNFFRFYFFNIESNRTVVFCFWLIREQRKIFCIDCVLWNWNAKHFPWRFFLLSFVWFYSFTLSVATTMQTIHILLCINSYHFLSLIFSVYFQFAFTFVAFIQNRKISEFSS